MPALALALALASAAAGAKGAPRDVDAFIRNVLHVAASRRAAADLNGDGRPEIFVYATSDCGSGGCDLTILSPRARGYRVVMRSSVTQLPVRLLATSSHGWRDVGVTIGGGGIRQAYMARLRFDGRRYPENPTVPPAQPMKHPSGRVLIAAPTLRR